MTWENVHVLVRKQIVQGYSPFYLFFLPLKLQLKNKKENTHVTEKERVRESSVGKRLQQIF